MSGTAADPRMVAPRQAPAKGISLSWSDPRLRNIVWQVLIIGFLVMIVGFLVFNTSRNLESRHIATGFGYLDRPAGIPIGEYLFSYDPAINTFGRALILGILNTLKVAVVGIVLTTILGTLIGIARMSKNWLLAKLSGIYVEVLRDIPLLLQLVFWYALLQGLPAPRSSFHPLPGVFLSNRGVKMPLLEWQGAHWWALAAFVAGWIGTLAWTRVAKRRQEETGVRPAVWPAALGLMVVFPALVWLALGAPFMLEMPVLRGFNFVGGGTISPEYGALTLGLTLYTAAYIAEIVRSGIDRS